MTATTANEVDAKSTSRFVDIPGFRIHYNEAGAGHTVVLLHGSGAGATGWSNFWPNIGALAQRFHVLAIDMPGWGESSTVDGLARDHPSALIAVLDALGVDRAALVGNSMGGQTSLVTAAKWPDRVSHLITMGAPSPGPALFAAGGGLSEGLKVLMEAYEDPSPANFKRLVQIMCFDQSMATDELANLRSSAALKHPEHLASFLQTRFGGNPRAAWFGMDEKLVQITAPTLLLHGRDDRVVPYEHSLNLLARIPNSRMVLLNRCGHWAQIEHADEFNRLVADFVDRT
ncbi:alpha/beta fold hydrolase [Dactylosporangium sp. CA-233914]|uniref:alpha/beta fold hydrolase n=1 Tax=Dactylosporangium sp. CA-233914 TaxID=3239934 RepID=UPI003D94B539